MAATLSRSQQTRLSKAATYLLRHGAVKAKLKMRSDGFVVVDDLLKNPSITKLRREFGTPVNLQHIQHMVDSCSKKRFSLETINHTLYIRANQGHSLKNVQVTMEQINTIDDLPEQMREVMHGTYFKAWENIKKTGLNKMTRQHIHFTFGKFNSKIVTSGMRQSCQVLVYIDIEKALADKIPFQLSANNVILSQGIDGVIAPKYFKYILRADNNQPFDKDYPNKPQQ